MHEINGSTVVGFYPRRNRSVGAQLMIRVLKDPSEL